MFTCSPLAPAIDVDTPTEMLNQGWAGVTHGVWDSSVSGGPLCWAWTSDREAWCAWSGAPVPGAPAPGHPRRGCRQGRRWSRRACKGRSEPSASTQGEARGRTTVGGCSPPRCPNGSAPTCMPPRSSRVASRRRAARCTWSGGSVRDALFPGEAGGGTRPRSHHRRPPRRDGASGPGLGRRAVDPGCALRDDRLSQGRPGLRDHDPPGRGLRPRVAQARGDLRRRHRRGPVAPRLHDQRAGPPPARHGAHRPLRRAG